MTNFPYPWFDSHCHFDFPDFNSDRTVIWQQAREMGCIGLLIPGISREQGDRLADVCRDRPWFYAQGLHPYFLASHRPQDIDWLDRALADPAVVAVGEAGLDKVLATDDELLAQQWLWFRQQAELARAHRLPLTLHIRAMHDEAAAWLKRSGFDQGGMVHAFSGSEQQGRRWHDLGFVLGIGGAVTHPRAQKLRRTVAALPESSIVLETDSPDMAPAFWAGRRNDPRSLPLTAALVARLRQVDTQVVSAKSISNMSLLFPKLSINV